MALARATYADADLYLFDDPLSAVDAHVGKHIFEELIGPKGLLRRKTRVLVTHGIVYLPHMDHIYVMKDGEITRDGTYKELINEKGEFADFLKNHITSEDVEVLESSDLIEDLKQVIDEQSLRALKERQQSQSESELVSSTERQGSRRRRPESERNEQRSVSKRDSIRKASVAGGPESDTLIEAEHSETESVKVSIYLDYFKAAGVGFAFGTFVLYLAFQGKPNNFK